MTTFATKIEAIMKKIVFILFAVVLLASCRKEYTIELHTNRDYGVIIKNCCHDSIYVQCAQLAAFGMAKLASQEETKPLFTEEATIEVKWFGDGTYFHQREKTFLLQKDEIITIELKNE